MSVIPVDVIEHAWLENKECAVDPAFFGLRFLREFDNLIPLHLQMAEPGCRANRGESSQLPMPTVECKQLMQVDIGHSIAPRKHERPLVEVRSQAQKTPAGLRLDAGINQLHAPVFDWTATHSYPARSRIDGQITVQAAVVDHVLFDDFALIAQGDDKVAKVVVRVVHHDVP